MPADYDGDGKTDQAVFRDGTWWILPSINGAGYGVTWGEPGDVPMAADFDADRKADYVVWRPSEQRSYIAPSSSGAYWVWWGAPRDLPYLVAQPAALGRWSARGKGRRRGATWTRATHLRWRK